MSSQMPTYSPNKAAPKILSARRLTTLVSSLIVALGSGTNYVYSAYAPQLGSRLRISHTKLNIIGLAGNVGVYSSGPFLGRLVDRRGPRMLLAGAFVCLLVGYSGIRHFFDSPNGIKLRRVLEEETLSTASLCVLVLCSFLTGMGGNAGLSSAVNATAKSFPDHMRATTTAIVLSGFGLSAFFFSTIAHIMFPDDTSEFLLLLALGTSLPMILGFFLIKPIPLPSLEPPLLPSREENLERRTSFSDIPQDGFAHTAGVDGVFGGDTVVFEHQNDSRTNLLHGYHVHRHHHSEGASEFLHEDHGVSAQRANRSHSLELARSPPPEGERRRSVSRKPHKRSQSRVIEVMQDLQGRALFTSVDFWLLFSILSLLSGTGIMYINNVGSIAQALFARNNPDFDGVESAKWQATQVSVISIANCLGRITAGVGADIAKNQIRVPRSYCICVVAAAFVLSQAAVTQIEGVEDLWHASALLGLAYGGVFGLFPTITIEWFGLAHFSENWGYVSLAPLFGGNLFSLAFGRNLDKHAAPAETPTLRSLFERAGVSSGQQCFEGKDCYVSSLYLTIFATTLAFFLSLYAAWKDRKRMTIVEGTRISDLPDVIWEEDEEEI